MDTYTVTITNPETGESREIVVPAESPGDAADKAGVSTDEAAEIVKREPE